MSGEPPLRESLSLSNLAGAGLPHVSASGSHATFKTALSRQGSGAWSEPDIGAHMDGPALAPSRSLSSWGWPGLDAVAAVAGSATPPRGSNVPRSAAAAGRCLASQRLASIATSVSSSCGPPTSLGARTSDESDSRPCDSHRIADCAPETSSPGEALDNCSAQPAGRGHVGGPLRAIAAPLHWVRRRVLRQGHTAHLEHGAPEGQSLAGAPPATEDKQDARCATQLAIEAGDAASVADDEALSRAAAGARQLHLSASAPVLSAFEMLAAPVRGIFTPSPPATPVSAPPDDEQTGAPPRSPSTLTRLSSFANSLFGWADGGEPMTPRSSSSTPKRSDEPADGRRGSSGDLLAASAPLPSLGACGAADGSAAAGPVDAEGTVDAVRRVIPDAFLDQLCALASEDVPSAPVPPPPPPPPHGRSGGRRGLPLGTGLHGLLGEAHHLDDEASHHFEFVLAVTDATLGSEYVVQRRLLRHHTYAYRSRLTLKNARADDLARFMLEDDIAVAAFDNVLATDRLPAPGDRADAAPALLEGCRRPDSGFIYAKYKLPIGHRHYSACRRAWHEPGRAAYFVSLACPNPHAQTHSNGAHCVSDYRAGYAIRCAPPPVAHDLCCQLGFCCKLTGVDGVPAALWLPCTSGSRAPLPQ